MKWQVASLCLGFALSNSVLAQGTIQISNRNIPKPSIHVDPPTYNVPIFNSNGEGIGSAPGGATLGLFVPSNLETPFASIPFRAPPLNGTEFVLGSTEAIVPGVAIGQSADIVIRVWTGQTPLPGQWAEWRLTTLPLGGFINGVLYESPGLTGWGSLDGAGYVVPEPSVVALSICGLVVVCMLRRRREACLTQSE